MSTVDFQAIRHQIEAENVGVLSSMFLGTGDPGRQPPTQLSEHGYLEVLKNTDLVQFLHEASEAADDLIRRYGSVEVAKHQDPEAHGRWRKLSKRHSTKLGYLQEVQFRIECKRFFEDQLPQVPSPATVCDISGQATKQSTVSLSGDEPVDSALLEEVANASLLEDDLDDTERLPDALIDPRLLEEVANASLSEDGLDDTERLLEPQELSGARLLDLEVTEEIAEAEEGMSELISEVNQAEAESDEPEQSTNESSFDFRTRPLGIPEVGRHSLVENFSAHLHQNPQNKLSILSAYFVDFFNHLHAADQFSPGQEPLPGTWNCSFCGAHFCDIEHDLKTLGTGKIPGKFSPQYHALHCEWDGIASHVQSIFRARQPQAVANCPLLRRKNGILRPCGVGNMKVDRYTQHLRQCHRTDTQDFFCIHAGVPDRLTFGSLLDFQVHIIMEHNVGLNMFRVNWPFAYAYFCYFCRACIPRTEENEEAHLTAHIQNGDLHHTISTIGIPGIWNRRTWTHPGFCPFCLYNPHLKLLQRCKVLGNHEHVQTHIEAHLASEEGTGPCPVTAITPEGLPQCSATATFDSDNLRKHLNQVHGYQLLIPQEEQSANGSSVYAPKRPRLSRVARPVLQDRDANQQLPNENDERV